MVFLLSGTPDVKAEKTSPGQLLKVAVDPHFPPYQVRKSGQYAGFDIDLMNQIAKEQDLRIEYSYMPKTKSIKALQEGEIDIVLGLPFSAEVSEKVDFTERYITSSVGVLVPEDSPLEELTDLQGKRVAIQYSTLEYDFLRNIRGLRYHSVHRPKTAIQVLDKERADAAVGNRITIEYLLQEYGLEDQYRFLDSHLLPLEYSMAVQKGDYRLLHTLNTGIRELKLTESYVGMYDQWFGQFESPLKAKLKKFKEIMLFIVVVALIILGIAYRWNRILQREVNRKTADLQSMNLSLQDQMIKTKNSDQFKEQILESSGRGVVTCDQDGIITTINSAARKLMHPEDAEEGENVLAIPFLRKIVDGEMDDVLYANKRISRQEMPHPLDGDRTIRYDIKPFLFNFEERTTGILIIVEDITMEKQMKDQLYEQEKSQALIQLVGGLAHEIRNPLTSIKTFVQLIPLKINNAKFREEITHLVPREINRLNELVEGLINYAKPKSGIKTTIYLEELIPSVASLVQQEAESQHITIEISIEPGLAITADHSQVSQILINLFLNAMDTMEEKRNGETFDFCPCIQKRQRNGYRDQR